MSNNIHILFPHQLFDENPLLKRDSQIVLIEEYLFFKQYNFHKQKIAFHRASMKNYQNKLLGEGYTVQYIESNSPLSKIEIYLRETVTDTKTTIHIINPVDNWLERNIKKSIPENQLQIHETSQFLNTKQDLAHFFRDDKTFFFQTTFYKQQRKQRNILIDTDGNPEGGKWTYDVENRKKYPKNKIPPTLFFPETNKYWKEALVYVEKYFSNNLGEVNTQPIYPTSSEDAKAWLLQFLEYRFFEFGIYEDAIVKEESFLNHSILSPLLNSGLLTPHEVIDTTLNFTQRENIPINSTEGFIRQIIGWREFIRGIYELKGTFSRNRNYWNFTRKIPKSFYDGTTGIPPIDTTIKKVLKTGYCHHIERLMVLGNFMLLCEFHPDDVYQWFMELFIDAYDWVMVPNIYGMSQFSDGGVFATKPYIGGSNYIKKMSNYPKGDWEKTWDGLFWHFIYKHQSFFKSNPRTLMIYRNFERLSDDKKQEHLKNAALFLNSL